MAAANVRPDGAPKGRPSVSSRPGRIYLADEYSCEHSAGRWGNLALVVNLIFAAPLPPPPPPSLSSAPWDPITNNPTNPTSPHAPNLDANDDPAPN